MTDGHAMAESEKRSSANEGLRRHEQFRSEDISLPFGVSVHREVCAGLPSLPVEGSYVLVEKDMAALMEEGESRSPIVYICGFVDIRSDLDERASRVLLAPIRECTGLHSI